VAVAAAALTACGTGFNAQTQQWYNPTDGSGSDPEQTLEGMAVRDLVVVSDGTDAAVLATVVNTGTEADQVTAIAIEGTPATIEGTLEAQQLWREWARAEVLPGSVLRVGEPADTVALISGASLPPGGLTEVEFTFATAPAQTLEAVVQAPINYYENSLPGGE
jgi:hypothetical protein